MAEENEVTEPENVEAPEVGASGKLKEGESEEKKEPTIDEIKQAYEKQQEFISGVYSYVKQGEEGLEWDVPRIVEELGFDPSSLRKKGEKKVEEVKTEKPAEPSKPEVTEKSLKEEFNKDPVSFLKNFAADVAKQVKEEIGKPLNELREDNNSRKARDMINEAATRVAEEGGDFHELESDIANLAKRFPPKTAEDLVDLYNLAVDRKKRGIGSGLGGTNQGPAKAGKKPPQKSPEEEIADKIVGSSKIPKNGVNMTKLFGKAGLRPID